MQYNECNKSCGSSLTAGWIVLCLLTLHHLLISLFPHKEIVWHFGKHMVNETLQPAADYFLARCLEKTPKVQLGWPAAGCSVIFTVQTWERYRPSHLEEEKKANECVSQNVKLVLYRVSALSDLALQHRYMYMLLQFLHLRHSSGLTIYFKRGALCLRSEEQNPCTACWWMQNLREW